MGADQHIFPPNDPIEYDVFDVYQLDQEVQAVILGLDTEFTFSKLALGALYINELNCKFIATNDDIYIDV